MDFNELKNKVLSTLGKGVDSAKDLAGKGVDGAKDLAGKGAEMVKTGSRIAKLNMEISSEKENMKKAFLEIGKLYYDTHKDDPEGFFIQLCDEVAISEKNIADKQVEIDELKAGDAGEDISVEFESVVADEESAAEEPACCCDKDEEE